MESSGNGGQGSPSVAVVGVGGAGVNAVARLMDVGVEGPRFIVADTSEQTLARAPAAEKIAMGAFTRGFGTGSQPELGAAAAESCVAEIRRSLAGSDLVFVAAGLAGGTGGGAAPVIARIAKELEAVTVGFGVTPFDFEAPRRAATAERAREALAEVCDATVILENQRALAVAGTQVPLDIALRVADDVLRQAVQGLSDLVSECGPINVDLAVVRDVLAHGGECCLALGIGRGPTPALTAMRAALDSPLADMKALGQAPAVLVQVTGSHDLSVHDTADAVDVLRKQLRDDCRLVVGTGHDPTLNHACQVTVLGTGLFRAPRTVMAWSGDRRDWRREAGVPGAEPRRALRYPVTGQVMGPARQAAPDEGLAASDLRSELPGFLRKHREPPEPKPAYVPDAPVRQVKP